MDLDSVQACDRQIRRIYDADLSGSSGVIHVASMWRGPDDRTWTLAMIAEAPVSTTDAFVLGLARARVDAIVTTGRILRDEPRLGHGFGADLRVWRRWRRGREEAPRSVVLTGTGELPFDHPVIVDGPARPPALVVTDPEVARDLAPTARRAGVELVGRPSPSLRDTITYLREERGVRDIGVEAGPTTARELYRDPPLVDELMLSVFEEPKLEDAARGPAFVPDADWLGVLGEPVSTWESVEESGRWTFYRYVGRAPGVPRCAPGHENPSADATPKS